jgi:hypothetical protein
VILSDGKIAVDDMKVGPAYGASFHPDANFFGSGLRKAALLLPKPIPRRLQDHRFHHFEVPSRMNGTPRECRSIRG